MTKFNVLSSLTSDEFGSIILCSFMHQRNSSVVEELEFHLAAKERVVPVYLVHSQKIRHFFKIILKAISTAGG